MNNKRSNQYVVYDKEENLIMVGNSAEITEKLGITIGTFYSYVSRGDSSKSNYRIYLIKGRIIIYEKLF